MNQIATTLKNNKPQILLAIKIIIWISFLYISTFVRLQALFIIVSGFYLIFANLGKRQGNSLSAYSVFNKGFKKPAGTFTTEQMLGGAAKSTREQQRIFGEEEQAQAIKLDSYFANQSKYGNKPCPCESGIKFKKCCLLKKRNQPKIKKSILQQQID